MNRVVYTATLVCGLKTVRLVVLLFAVDNIKYQCKDMSIR